MSNEPVIYFDKDKHPLESKDFEDIQVLLDKFPLEDITIGDAGEVNNCQVGRLVEDNESFSIRVDSDPLK